MRHFLVKSSRVLCFWGVLGGSRRYRAASDEVLGQRKPRAPERRPESAGRGLDDDFQVEAFFCQVWSFSMLLGRLQVGSGGIELSPRRSQEVRGSLELQNGSLRALEEAWMTTFRLRNFPVKSGRFLCLWAGTRLAEGSLARSRAVSGGVRKARAPEWWLESA